MLGMVLMFMCWGAPGWSQDQPENANTARTSTGRVQDPRLPSGFVSSVNLLDDTSLGGPAEALARLPGVVVRQSSRGQPAFLQIRGGQPRQVVVLLNGLRIKVPAGLGFDLGTLSTAGLSSLQLYRGGAGAIFGAGALTGALNLVIEPPRRFVGRRLHLTQSFGSFGFWRTGARLDLAPSKRSAMTTAVEYRQATGDFPFVDRQGQASRRVNNDHSNLQAVASARWRAGDDTWRVTTLLNRGELGVPGPSEFQRQFAFARLQHTRVLTNTSWRHRNALKGAWGVMDVSLRSGLQWQKQSYDNPTAYLGGGGFTNQNQAIIAEGQLQTQWFLKTSTFLTTQLDARYETFTSRSPSDDPGSEDAAIGATRRVVAGALSVEQVLLNNTLSLVGVLRVEGVDNQPSAQPNLLLPAFGAVIKPAARVEIKGNIARTARIPDFDELYLNHETVRGNPNLDAESAWVADLGVHVNLWAQLAMETVVFGQLIDEVILFVPRTAYLVQATNVGEASQYGVEQSLAWRLHRRLQLEGAYTWTVAQFRNALRTQFPNQPRHQARLASTLSLANVPGLRWADTANVMLQWRWRSKITLDNFARLENNSVHLVQAGIDLGWRKAWTLRMDVQNILDVQTALDSLQRPLPGRRFSVALRYAFDVP